MKKFPERLKTLRQEYEYSQAKFGLIFGQSQQTIDRWERGLHEPNMEMIMKLAAFFKVTTDYLIGFSDDMYVGERRKKDPEIVATVSGNIGNRNNINIRAGK